jgi:hypothetical protein
VYKTRNDGNVPTSAGLVVYYVVYNGVRLLVMVEWTIMRTTRRGIQFQARGALRQTRKELISQLREKLERSMERKPSNDRKPKIIAAIGFGGGGHAATVRGVMDVMKEAGFQTEMVEIPIGFLVETDDKNPLWNITQCTGEQLYNWGLRQAEWVAFVMMWLLSLGQACALNIDKICGFVGQVIGKDYGDEVLTHPPALLPTHAGACFLCCNVAQERWRDGIEWDAKREACRMWDARTNACTRRCLHIHVHTCLHQPHRHTGTVR